ncbi:MAG TPA: NAD(P)/FAD-dependent oxidoreductase [Candidatus Limnocylindrales bacterium]|nr:NAD(P)/FAD-dependent oxidoreductase [Candidatus Limnocylindrales bacterium]
MSKRPARSVAILGGGPAGASLGAYLARAGVRVVLFHKAKRPPIIVGESLVPAIVPFLRRLGVEQQVEAFSTYKPGATFVLDLQDDISFRFDQAIGAEVNYSYNTPRDKFDAVLLQAARDAGATVIEATAGVEREGTTDRVRLSAKTLEMTAGVFSGQPDWIVDATGRSRTIGNLLDIPYVEGPRKDSALHAHLTGVPLVVEGNVHTDRMLRGWCWRIPLPGRVSLGLVVNEQHLARFGPSVEDQFAGTLREEPLLARWSADAERITPVVKYTNYQQRSTRGVGENWATVGDAFGFIDPVFSSGLLIGMEGALELSRALVSGSERSLRKFEEHVLYNLTVWQRLVDYYYNGSLFTLFKIGQHKQAQRGWKVVNRHFGRHMPRVFTGEATRSRYSVGLVDFMVKWGTYGHDCAELRVR